MHELDFITDMVEEQFVKGDLRWLANFSEIKRDIAIGDVTFPIYASGSLQERGFILSRIFSALVTPRYKVHFFLYTSPEIDPKFLRKMILECKNNFGTDDWILIGLVQSQPLGKTTKDAVENVTDKNIGIAAYSLAPKETVTSNNVLGKGLAKQLKLTEAKFEIFDWPNYLKSFTMIFALGVLLLLILFFSGIQQAIQPLTLLIMAIFSLIIGHRVYKTRYHMTLTLSNKGFQLDEGKKVTEGKWSSYSDVTIHITPSYETFLRLHSKDSFDLPLSRVGLSRKEVYSAVRDLVKKRQGSI
jgi:hypothetical protein